VPPSSTDNSSGSFYSAGAKHGEQATFYGQSGKEQELSKQTMFNLLNWDFFNFSHSICIPVHLHMMTSININTPAFVSVNVGSVFQFLKKASLCGRCKLLP